MALNITRGVIPKAQKVVIYGPEGIGKTTFAAQFPNPLFIDTEGGTESYDVARTETPKSWTALIDQVKEVARVKPCSTLVLDTADWAESLAITELCAKRGWTSIEQPGWGAGYTELMETFNKLLNALGDVRDVGINVVITAHAMTRKFEQPNEAAAYDRWELKLQKKVAPKVVEWADTVLFFNYKTIVEVVGEGKKAHGKARGNKRVMYTEHDAVWDGKCRWGLPPECPMDYSIIAPYIPDLMAQQPAQEASQPTPVVTEPQPAAQAAEPAPAQATFVTPGPLPNGELPDFWAPAEQLMQRDGITIEEIRKVARAWGHFTLDTPPENFPPDYITGCLVPNWADVQKAVDNIRFNEIEVPFN